MYGLEQHAGTKESGPTEEKRGRGTDVLYVEVKVIVKRCVPRVELNVLSHRTTGVRSGFIIGRRKRKKVLSLIHALIMEYRL